MIRPVDVAPSQLFGDNPTSALPSGHWIIKQFGNYQPDGHTGEDYPCKSGTPVRAVTSGTVLHVGRLAGTYTDNPWWISPSFAGFVYVVDHGAFIGIYGHCLDGGARVIKGQRVAEGQILGLSGNTGASTGDHLHFEILLDGYILNSRTYGRINPGPLFATTINALGTVTPLSADSIITKLQEAGVALELKDLEQIQGIIQSERETIVNELRAQATWVLTELAQKVADSAYQVKVFNQETFNPRFDQVVGEVREAGK